MIYLIPAWYKQNSWNECDQNWYVRRTESEYDDTVKQMQLFHRNKVWPSSLLILSFMPNLRHFLHRQGMYRANYWSCFDAMLEIKRTKIGVFSYRDIKWPEGISFDYTSFAIIAYLNNEKYAQVEFGEDGNLIKIDMFKDGMKIRTNYYDDRGFVSGSIVYENGVEKYQDYLMENGIWKLRVYAEDGHVDVNPQYNTFVLRYKGEDYSLTYNSLRYDSLDEVIKEVFAEYIALTEDEDIFCIAAHERHKDIVYYALNGRLSILSFFENRMPIDERLSRDSDKGVNYIVADTTNSKNKIQKLVGDSVPVIDISPYDTRMDFGISQQMQVYKILVTVDALESDFFEEIVSALCAYLSENARAEVHFLTRQTTYNRKKYILQRTREVLNKIGADERMARDDDEEQKDLLDENETPKRFFVEQCIDELSVSRCMREQRILVDLSEEPDAYIQIAAVSAAIPQITKYENQYMQDGENGMVVDSAFLLLGALRFFLNSLANWNEAMICASEICKQFSTRALLDRWKEVIEEVGRNKDAGIDQEQLEGTV